MGKEIERKYIVSHFPPELKGVQPQVIEQGYLALEPHGQEVRLRKTNTGYFLTVKSIGTLERREYETSLTFDQFQKLWPGTFGRRIRKKRYLLKRNVHTIEVDVYLKPLKGLILAEVEFPSLNAANSYTKEEWMGREVTQLNFLKNRTLLQFDSIEELMQKL